MNTNFAKSIDGVLARAARFGLDRPRSTLGIAALLVTLSIGAGFGTRFKSDVSDLMPASMAAAYRQLESVFGAGDSAFALVTSDRAAPGELVEVAQLAASTLEKEELVRAVTFGWSAVAETMTSPQLLQQALLFAGPDELETLRALLTPAGIAAQVRKVSLQLGLPGLGEAEAWTHRDPLELRRFLVARGAALRGGFRFLPGSMHFLAEDGRAILIRIDGRKPCADIEAVKVLLPRVEAALHGAVERVLSRASPPLRLELGLTGGYVFAREMEAAVRADLTWNNVGSMLLCLLVVALAYRSLTLVLPSLVALTVGIIVGFGVFALLERELVTLALVSGAALAGLGIDYVIYITLRAFDGPEGLTRESIIAAVTATGRPILLAATATAAGFLTFLLSGEQFLADVGLISAIGIVACALASIVVLPALLRPWVGREERLRLSRPPGARPAPWDFGAAWLARIGLAWPRAVVCLSLVSVVAGSVYLLLHPPALEQDLRRMQPAGSEAVRVQQAITTVLGGAESPVLVILHSGESGIATSVDEAAQENAVVEAAGRLEAPLRELLAAGSIAAWSSPAFLLPPPSQQRVVQELLATLDAGALEGAFQGALEENDFDLDELKSAREVFGQALRPQEFVTAGTLRRLGLAGEVNKLVGRSQGQAHALIAVHPAQQLWRSEDQSRLTAQLQEALAKASAPGIVTGLQILSTRQAQALLEEFLYVSGAALAAVALIVLLCLRSAVGSLLALLPVLLGTLWMMVGCGLLGVPLNFMNVGVLPMVLGTGVDIGIHLALQYLDDPHGDVARVLEQAGGSIQIASLTTLAAFGTMIWSVSPGLASVGTMATLGTLGCLVASLVTLPATLLLHARRAQRRKISA